MPTPRAFRRILCLLAVLFLLPAPAAADGDPRLPGPAEPFTEAEEARILAAGDAERSPWLDAGFTLLEEGNPFAVRYSLLTGAEVKVRLPLGVPYLYGGQAASHVFAKAPDYVVQAAWIDSPCWYVKGLNYLYGFDCVGFAKWLWTEVNGTAWPGSDALLEDRARHVPGTEAFAPDWETTARLLRPGDILILRRPGNHVAVFIGTLRDFGYTAEEVPELAAFLDYPLVIHASTNAAMAPRFARLIETGDEKYRGSQTTDGGVCVALLGVPKEAVPGHAFAQNQDTWYFTLPDGTWLPVLLWEHVEDFGWWRGDPTDGTD